MPHSPEFLDIFETTSLLMRDSAGEHHNSSSLSSNGFDHGEQNLRTSLIQSSSSIASSSTLHHRSGGANTASAINGNIGPQHHNNHLAQNGKSAAVNGSSGIDQTAAGSGTIIPRSSLFNGSAAHIDATVIVNGYAPVPIVDAEHSARGLLRDSPRCVFKNTLRRQPEAALRQSNQALSHNGAKTARLSGAKNAAAQNSNNVSAANKSGASPAYTNGDVNGYSINSQQTAEEHKRIAFCSALLQTSPQIDNSALPSDRIMSDSVSPTRQDITSTGAKGYAHQDLTSLSSLENDSQAPIKAAAIQPLNVAAIAKPEPFHCNNNNNNDENSYLPSVNSNSAPNGTGDCEPAAGNGDRIYSFSDSNGSPTKSEPGEKAIVSQLLMTRQRLCTSFRLKLRFLKNPVDACLLSNGNIAIADYDNGFFVVNAQGDEIEHKDSPVEKNACGISCTKDSLRVLVLIFRDGFWSINVYATLDLKLIETIVCPTDASIEGWALRKLVLVCDSVLHLMGSGEAKCCVWMYEFAQKTWRVLLAENSRKGGYNDLSVKYDEKELTSTLLLCDMKKSQLSTVVVDAKGEVVDTRSIRVRRVKGQEWVVQGPNLATMDEDSDIIVYDSSGKLFFFDGDSYKCKKIIADIGRGEASSVLVRNGWAYVLCRYRLCIDAFLYKEELETFL